ncbi:hypothetical protein M011DRAFT_403778 [Sporormia fimetaria CBS 119925]|uniref:Uncharacterized protein n=1 Tax=Sporormia fimetaria CBS 119925 TaxID=1340428 RepID=A0A6A6V7N6_9PLEO|nr:hypothetical protein M011DRAFT_403778 [Sporormia fimetaria CBS 119925]
MTIVRRLWRRVEAYALIATLFGCLYLLVTLLDSCWGDGVSRFNSITSNDPLEIDKELVVASLARDDVEWLDTYFADWTKNVYVVDDASAPLTVPKNKGREAMAYLTYIIDRYDTLPSISIFLHSLRYQWHNEDPMYDGAPVLRNLRLPHVLRRGYVSLRCTWVIGCPAELWPRNPSRFRKNDDRAKTEVAYADAFRILFPGTPVPDIVGAHASSQFAVSREQIRARPKKEYERMRAWLLLTPLPDAISGRVLEYMWHIVFGMPAVDCQDAGECFCQTFGLCNLTCSQKECLKRYRLAPFTNIPKGWPEVGPGTHGWPERGWAD